MRYLVFILCLSPLYILAQDSKHVVVDKLTSQPIADVHIVVANSSLSTYTDQEGVFTIDQTNITGLDIILSHISYDLLTISMPLTYVLPDTIGLTPLAIEVADIQVVAKRSNAKKKRLKKFRRDLFTSDDASVHSFWKKCTINNPESILFYTSADTMLAESARLISIRNPYLGYELSFLLEDYYSTKKASAFNGKIVFAELDQLKTSKKKINQRRLEKHARSEQAFFSHLLTNTLREGEFNCYIKDSMSKKAVFLNFLEGERLKEYVKETVIAGVYAFICPADVFILAGGKQSIISTSHGLVLFNKNGVILNKNEITVEGYWSRLSLSEQLPMDFKAFDYDSVPIIPFEKAYTILELRNYKVKEENEEERIRIQEIVVETDRLLYKRGEYLYVSGHIFNHDTWKHVEDEQIISIDLVNSKGEVVEAKKKLVKGGVFESGFEIKDTLEPGHYAIHVHSSFSASLSSSKVVWINTMYTDPSALKGESETAIISFCPEGNSFVRGSINKVLLKIHDELGRPIPFTGSLRNEDCGFSVPVQTFCDGLAVVHLMSREECDYVLVSEDDRKLSVDYGPLLPQEGASLNITVRNREFFVLKILSNIDLKNYKIQVKYKGDVVYTLDDLKTKNAYKLNKNLFQNGILDFQLISEGGEVLSSRIIDHSRIADKILRADMNYAFYNQRQEGSVKFTLRDSSLKKLEWNLRIVNSEYDPKAIATDVFDELAPALSPVNFEALRNDKMIGEKMDSWYKEQYNSSFSTSTLPTKQKVSGRTVDTKSGDPIATKVSITHLGEAFYYDELESTEEGAFSFENLPFIQGGEFVIQARKNVKRGEDISKGNRNVKIIIDSLVRNKPVGIRFPEEQSEVDYSVDSFASARPSFSLNVDIDQVTVTARRTDFPSSSTMFNLNEMDWIRDNSSGISLLTRLHPSKRIKKDPEDPNQLLVWIRRGEPVGAFKRLLINIDGQRQLDATSFMNMIADEISFIGINNQTLTVVRTPDLKRRSKRRAEKYGIHTHVFKENIDNTDKDYVNKAKGIAPNEYDGRKTISWQPRVRFDDIEKDIRFLTSQVAGTYLIEMSTIHPEYGYITYNWTFLVQ